MLVYFATCAGELGSAISPPIIIKDVGNGCSNSLMFVINWVVFFYVGILQIMLTRQRYMQESRSVYKRLYEMSRVTLTPE